MKWAKALELLPRYGRREPYKVKAHIQEEMRRLRLSGKSYSVIGGLCGVSSECARKWLTGQTPKNLLSTKTLGVGDSGKRGFPVVFLETAKAVKVRRMVNLRQGHVKHFLFP